MYRLEIRKRAETDIEWLPEAVARRVISTIGRLPDDPRPPGGKKLIPAGAYRLRLGDYRIVYEVDDASKLVTITRVRHRREVYRR